MQSFIQFVKSSGLACFNEYYGTSMQHMTPRQQEIIRRMRKSGLHSAAKNAMHQWGSGKGGEYRTESEEPEPLIKK